MSDSPIIDLADQLQDRLMAADPFEASAYGLREYDALVPDASAAAAATLHADVTALRERAAAIPRAEDGSDTVLAAVIDATCHKVLLQLEMAPEEFTVTALPISGPPALFGFLSITVLQDEAAARDYLTRVGSCGALIDQLTDRLREGAAKGRTPIRSLAEQAVQWGDAALAAETLDAVLAPQPPEGWDGAAAWHEQLAAAGRDVIRPALERWRDAVRDELLPVARTDEHAGISWLPGGDADYLKAIEIHTTLPLTADQLHRIGLETIARLEQRAAELGASLGLPDLAAVVDAVRAAAGVDPQSALESVRAAVRRAEARAEEVLPPPSAPPCAVEPMTPTVADSGMAPHYTIPLPDGSRPGTYWFNTRRSTAGGGWDLEAVAFHEAVPGHHLQLARSQTLTGLTTLQTQSLVTVHAEGWGLYAERLAEEMGLYSSTQQQIGAIYMELHRAARLVVDTGMHAMGWSRRQAREFITTHVALPEGFLHAEIDRYLSWPGQALAYLTGQREFLRLREHAREVLGEEFDLRGFHATVLDSGSVPMPVLEVVVQKWISSHAG